MKTITSFLFILLFLFAGCSLLGSDAGSGRRTIVFSALAGDHYQIFSMREDGSGVRQLTHADTYAMSPAWSPDGKRIAFESGLKAPIDTPNLYVMDADGGNVHPLVTNPLTDGYPFPGRHPAWSPDGSKLAFDYCPNCEAGGRNHDIMVADLQTGTIDTLTKSLESDIGPVWSPDGKNIVFTSDRDYVHEDSLRFRTDLYLINTRNHGLSRLTNSGFTGSYTWKNSQTLLYVTYTINTNLKKIRILNIKTKDEEIIADNLDVSQFWIYWNSTDQQVQALDKKDQQLPLTFTLYGLQGNRLAQKKLENKILKSGLDFDFKNLKKTKKKF